MKHIIVIGSAGLFLTTLPIQPAFSSDLLEIPKDFKHKKEALIVPNLITPIDRVTKKKSYRRIFGRNYR